ncbi:amino acid ABC transporter permease [Pelagovum pacificum]|uniref:ABC transporter permease subunit n=1 Tax=Pelagovum pacificum TaxID=2588711 RepID=A0A5C5GFN5_9RHOB|nr:ABC transporter permease subunit [Pelagovum pacificum]QQA43361.1 ABC transporter permease subunit [Pelagovum pacificum]TNY33503.1 ABC transporter permease subunit [Pelagovum pacificum]
MTTISDPPARQGFRPSQLIYDTRYRSLTIQVVAMILLMLAASWLVSNTIQNLESLGKDFDFGFLGQSAGYDINQRLIPYENQDTHGRAALVGILNTILVAFMGCALATVLGVIAGVLRLSSNWVVSRLISVYVEGFRNVPLLLWIILIFAVVNESMPHPRDFASTSDMFLNSIAVTRQGTWLPAPIFGNLSGILLIVFLASLVAIYGFRYWARKRQEATGEILPVFRISLALFILPTLIAYFILGMPISLDYPEPGRFRFEGGLLIRNSLIALWLALSLYTGAFIAEIVRSGILSVSKGQSEASFALGLRPNRTMNLVILPQAMRVIVPPLISQFLNLTKNSSLAIAVGYMDVRATLGGITINQTGRELEGMLLLGLFYLVLSLVISGVMNLYNNRVKLKER